MKKHWYRLLGITEEQVMAWSEDMREDLNFVHTNDGEMLALIKLNWLESIVMRFQMIRSNFANHYGFRLRRI